MSAGRDVERLIASWLAEEAAPGAPDRVLDSTRQAVHRTNQRRFAALWRDSMLSPYRPLAMAAMLVVAVIGGALIGRLTAPSGVGSPVTTPAQTATSERLVSLEDYRTARNAICNASTPQVQTLIGQIDKIYDPTLTAAQRAPKVVALSTIASVAEQVVRDLDRLDVPTAIAADHAAQLAYYRSTIALIRQAVDAIGNGDLAGAQALDLATDPNSRAIEGFESKYGLAACP